ncbi:hypothetical protein BC834DRAFT_848773 [Gloeopeniophorella convolvens]|nr:hypothetical protein BC834DRAFT_848773 [Gloeopeniophorella convolvens]
MYQRVPYQITYGCRVWHNFYFSLINERTLQRLALHPDRFACSSGAIQVATITSYYMLIIHQSARLKLSKNPLKLIRVTLSILCETLASGIYSGARGMPEILQLPQSVEIVSCGGWRCIAMRTFISNHPVYEAGNFDIEACPLFFGTLNLEGVDRGLSVGAIRPRLPADILSALL